MKRILAICLLVPALASSLAVSYTPEAPLHPKLTNFHPVRFDAMPDNSLCYIVAQISDLEKWENLPGISFVSSEECSNNTWAVNAFLRKSNLQTILDLSFILSVEIRKTPIHLLKQV